jgi:hypothetical protein
MRILKDKNDIIHIVFLLALCGLSPAPAKSGTLDYLEGMVKKTKTEQGVKVTLQTDPGSKPIVVVGSKLPIAPRPTETTGYALSAPKGFAYSQNENILWTAEAKTPYMDILTDENYVATGFDVTIGNSGRSRDIRQALFGDTTQAPERDFEDKLASGNMVDIVTHEAKHTKQSKTDAYLNISLRRHKFEDSKDRNSKVITVTPGIDYDWNAQTTLSAEAFARIEDARDDEHSQSSYGARISMLRQVNDGLTTNIGYQFSRRSFNDQGGFAENSGRDDQESVVALTGSWDMTDSLSDDISLNLQYQYVRCDSSLSGYDYARQIGLVSLSKNW